jgi:hypothetical protein
MRDMSKTRTVLAAGILGIAAVTVGLAQGRGGGAAPPPQRMLVATTQVKPEMANAYEALIKNELLPAAKKGGQPFRWTFANGPTGGAGFTYVAVTPIANLAVFDEPGGPAARRAMGEAAWNAYQAKLRPMVVSTQSALDTMVPELSLPGGSTTPTPLVQVQMLQVMPGKMDEFTRIMTTDYLPNYRKAGVKDFTTYAISFGDVPQGRVVTVRGLAKYADLDGLGLLRRAGLSAEAAAEINTRRAAVATGVSNVVLRYIPEMSFGAAPARPASQ